MPFQFSAEKLAEDFSLLNKVEWTEHFVRNFSNEDRVHLVIDATVNDWITEIFKNSSV